MSAHLSWQTACELGFRGNLDELERLMGRQGSGNEAESFFNVSTRVREAAGKNCLFPTRFRSLYDASRDNDVELGWTF
jgi:hypothetical protein